MSVTLVLACGCQVKLDASQAATYEPVCKIHGTVSVERVDAPAPRFMGVAARGPLAVKG